MMDIEVGAKVVETDGFFKGCEFTVTGEYLGTHPSFGERKLVAPAVPLPPKKSLSVSLLDGDALPPLTEEETPLFSELVAQWGLVESVRVHGSASIEDEARGLFKRLGIDHPTGWRGTERGKRVAGAEKQYALAATVRLRDGRHFNNLGLTLRLLSEGREFGWRITKLA